MASLVPYDKDKAITSEEIEGHPMYSKLKACAVPGLGRLRDLVTSPDLAWLKRTFELSLPPVEGPAASSNEGYKEISYTFATCSRWYQGGATSNNGADTYDKEKFAVGGENPSGPITDIVVVVKGEKVPDGYKLFDRTRGGKAADLNNRNGGKSVHVAYSRSANFQCVTGLAVIMANRGEQPPPEFEVVRKTVQGAVADLNAGCGLHQLFLCIRRGFGTPLTEIDVYIPSQGESLAPGYVRLAKTVFGYPANLNSGSSGEVTNLSYKIDLDYLVRLSVLQEFVPNMFEAAFMSPAPGSPKIPGPETLQPAIVKDIDPLSSRNLNSSSPAPIVPKIIPPPTPSAFHAQNSQKFEAEAASNRTLRRAESLDLSEEFSTPITLGRRSSTMDLEPLKALTRETERENNRRVCFAYLKVLFPFLAALYCRDKSIINSTLAELQVLIDERCLFPPNEFLHDPRRMTPFDLFVSCLYHTSMMSINDLHGEVSSLIVKIVAIKRDTPDIVLSNRCIHRLYRTVLSSFTFFQNRFNLLEEKKRRALLIGRAKEIEGYSKAVAIVKEQMEATNRALIHYVEHVISFVENTNLKLVDPCDSPKAVRDGGIHAKSAPELAMEAIDLCLQRVELFYFTQETLSVFSLHTSTSTGFATDFNSLASNFFSSDVEGNTYLILMNVLKRISEPLKSSHKKDYSERVAGFDVLLSMLQATGPFFRKSVRWMYLIRRILVPVVITNLNGVEINIVPLFRRILQVTSFLWKHCKLHLKIEIAVLVEHFLIRMLRSKNAAPEQQVEIIQELSGWCDVPQGLIEMFLNYDNDQSGQPNVVFLIVSTLIDICQGQTQPVTVEKGTTPAPNLDLVFAAQSCLSVILRAIMNASATVHLISHDDRTKKLSEAGWVDDDESVASGGPSTLPIVEEEGEEGSVENEKVSSPKSHTRTKSDIPRRGSTLLTLTKQTVSGSNATQLASSPLSILSNNMRISMSLKFGPSSGQHRSSVRQRHAFKIANQKLIAEALQIIEKGKNVKKGIQFLVTMKYMEKTPRDVCNFLRLNLHLINENYLGDYLGDGGDGAAGSDDAKFMNRLREAFLGGISFAGMSFDEAFRCLLTKGGFRLPGEGQKIDRILEAFGEVYIKENPSDNLFKRSEDVYNLAFSTILLNTDLHNPNIRESEKMTLKQFIRQNEGRNFPEDFQRDLYNSIKANGIKLPQQGQALSLTSKKDPGTGLVPMDKNQLFKLEMEESATKARTVLLGEASSYRPYASKMSADLVRLLFEELWWEMNMCIEFMYKHYMSNKTIILECFDMLRYAISTSLFLGMELERQAFAELLARISLEIEQEIKPAKKNNSEDEERKRKEEKVAKKILSGKHLEKDWFVNIIKAETVGNVLDVIPQLHDIISELKDIVTHQKEFMELVNVQKKFTSSTKIVDTSRRLLKEATLTKICSNGKWKKYNFFLFNDILVYAEKNFFGKLSGRKELPLASMRIKDSSTPKIPNCFEVISPVKSFPVVAPDRATYQDWMRSIEQAVRDFNQFLPLSEAALVSNMEKTSDDSEAKEFSSRDVYEDMSPYVTVRTPAPDEVALASRPKLPTSFTQGSPPDDVPLAALPKLLESTSASHIASLKEEKETETSMTLTPRGRVSTSESVISESDSGLVTNGSFELSVERLQPDSKAASSVQKAADEPIRKSIGESLNNHSMNGSTEKVAVSINGGSSSGISVDDITISGSLDRLPSDSSPNLLPSDNRKSLHRSALSAELGNIYISFSRTKEELAEKGISLVSEADFLRALQFSQPMIQGTNLQSHINDVHRLQFFGLFKQATVGDCSDSNEEALLHIPSVGSLVSTSKIETWRSLKGMNKEVARTNYVLLLDSLTPNWREGK